jgi:hypothetical protein
MNLRFVLTSLLFQPPSNTTISFYIMNPRCMVGHEYSVSHSNDPRHRCNQPTYGGCAYVIALVDDQAGANGGCRMPITTNIRAILRVQGAWRLTVTGL